MTNAPSSKTVAVAFRVPCSVYAIIKKRADRQSKSVGEYLKPRVIYDVSRKHERVR